MPSMGAFPDILQFLRMQNLFHPPVGNDLPSQGGITGRLPIPPDGNGVPPEMPYQGIPPYTGISPDGTGAMPDVQGGFNVPPPTSAPMESAPYDAGKRMQELYTPEHEANDRYTELMNAYPNREDWHPGKLRRIGGALMAVASGLPQGRGMNFYKANTQGIDSGVKFMDQPFLDKQEDWKAQIVPAGQAATNERYMNANERSLANQTVNSELRQHQIDVQEENYNRRNNAAEGRLKLNQWKAQHPNAKFDFSGPTVKVGDPATGRVFDTGVQTGNMSEIDKLNLQGDMRLEQIGATGDEARKTEGVRETGREKIQEMKGWDVVNVPDPNDPTKTIGVRINRDNGQILPIELGGKPIAGITKPGTGNQSGGRPELPSQTRVRQFLLAQELSNTRPDLRPYIKLGSPGGNDFKVVPGGEGMFGHYGPTKEQAQEIQDYIYGNTTPAPAVSHGSSTTTAKPTASHNAPASKTTEAPPAPPGWKYVPKPGGGWTAVKAK